MTLEMQLNCDSVEQCGKTLFHFNPKLPCLAPEEKICLADKRDAETKQRGSRVEAHAGLQTAPLYSGATAKRDPLTPISPDQVMRKRKLSGSPASDCASVAPTEEYAITDDNRTIATHDAARLPQTRNKRITRVYIRSRMTGLYPAPGHQFAMAGEMQRPGH